MALVRSWACRRTMKRDFFFAKKYDLPIKIVVQPAESELKLEEMTEAYTGAGVMVNSGRFDGMANTEAKQAIVEELTQPSRQERRKSIIVSETG